VTFDGFALDYVEVATGPMTCADTPSRAATTWQRTIRRTCLVRLPRFPYHLPDTDAGTANHCRSPATVSGVVNMRRMRILVTGASGVLGRMPVPLVGERGHQLATPSSSQLDPFDLEQVQEAVHDVHVVLHLATRIPTPDRRNLPGAWDVNDRLRADATRLLVDGALSAKTELIVVPTAAFVYLPGPADKSTPLADLPEFLQPRRNATPRRPASVKLGCWRGMRPERLMSSSR
jgi:hypothetical protein